MALLITGAMGRIGYEVTQRAAADGMNVVAQYRSTFRAAEAAALGASVTWVSCELADRAAVERMVNEQRIDTCIHLAAIPNDVIARPDPVRAFNANVGAVPILLDAARRQKWRRFVFVSTGAVIQTTPDWKTALTEDAPASPLTIYGTTKYCAELMTRMFRTQYDVSAASVRISRVYGPSIADDDLPLRGPIPVLLKKAVASIPIREKSGADYVASFTYIDDVVAGLLALARAPKLNHDVYHLEAGVNYSLAQVVAAIRASVPGATIELGPGTEPWSIGSKLRPPLGGDRLFRDTGFKVSTSLETGIQKYADWLRARSLTAGKAAI
jgi:nucleoside-diphosphate-sugar epimerase